MIEVIVRNQIARVYVEGPSLRPYAEALRAHRAAHPEGDKSCHCWLLVLDASPDTFVGQLREVSDLDLTWTGWGDWEQSMVNAYRAGIVWAHKRHDPRCPSCPSPEDALLWAHAMHHVPDSACPLCPIPLESHAQTSRPRLDLLFLGVSPCPDLLTSVSAPPPSSTD